MRDVPFRGRGEIFPLELDSCYRTIYVERMATNTATATRNTEYTLASGRVIWIGDDGMADLSYDADLADYWASIAHDCEGEMKSEFAMSWVHGGGRAEDVNVAYRRWTAMKADWDSGYEF